MKTTNLGILLLVSALTTLSGSLAFAQSRDWVGGASDAWENIFNWSPNGVPLTNETINIGTTSNPNETSVLDNKTTVTINNLNLSNDSEFEIQGDLSVSTLADIDAGSELRMSGVGFIPEAQFLRLRRTSGLSLRNDGTINIDRGPAIIDSGFGAEIDLDGSTGDGRLFLNSGTTLQIKGPLSDAFNGTLEFGGSSGFSTILDMHDDWNIGNGGQVHFGGAAENRIQGGDLTATGALFDLGTDAFIEAPASISGSTITGETGNKLTFTKSASFTGGTTFDALTEVQGLGEINGGNQMTINSELHFLDSASISNSTIDLDGHLKMQEGGSIQDATITHSDSNAGLMAYTGPLTIGGSSEVDVNVLWNSQTSAPLTITGGDVAAKNWGNTYLNLHGGTAKVVDTGNITLPGGLSFGSDQFPHLRMEDGSTASIGSTGNGDLTMGFLAGENAQLTVEGIGRVSPGNPNRRSELSAGNARIGNRGQGSMLVREGGRANFTGDVKIGEFGGALGVLSVDGGIDDGAELFRSELNVGDSVNGITADLEVGNNGDGYLNVMNGARANVNGEAYFGRNAGGAGSLTVANMGLGSESVFSTAGDIHLGGGGAGLISQNEGGVILGDTMRVKQYGEYYHSGGISSFQTLDITDGGTTWVTDGTSYLQNLSRTGTGAFHHAGGEVYVQGGDAQFNTSYSFGGTDPLNQPRLYLESGTDATVTYGFRIGENADEYGQVRVAGATETRRSQLRGTGGGAGADLHVGRFGSGGLSIEDGGFVKILDDTLVASEAGSFGVLGVLGTTQLPSGTIERAELDVTGRGSQSSLYIGSKGHGILSLGQGGLVRVAGSTNVATHPGSVGEIYVFTEENGYSAELDITGNLNLGGEGQATLTLYDGGIVRANQLQMGSNSTLNMEGGLLSLEVLNATVGTTNFTGGEVDIDEVIGDVDFSNVTVTPGDSPGVMNIYGSASFDANSVLEIEIGGLASGSEHDHLFVSDQLALDGLLDIRMYDLGEGMFAPQAGDEFTIISSDNSIVGEFDAFGGDRLPFGLGWEVLYLPAEQPESVVLRAVELYDSSDLDFDEDVDSKDLALWDRSYAVGRASGSDFLNWQQQFDAPRGKTAFAAVAVPEPAGLVLALLGLVGILATERNSAVK